MAELTPDELLADDISEFYTDPLGYVIFVFPWDTDTSIQMVELEEPYKSRFPNCKYGPDVWACEFLDELGEEIKKRKFNGRDAVDPIQFATASGHGIGKSVLVAWLIKFILDTRPYSKGIVTAGTADQLKTKTWAELGKWHRMSLTEHWFRYNAGRGAMNLSHVDFPERWRCDALTCKEENSDSFAGLHAAEATPFYIFDEAVAVPDAIYEVRQGGTTDGEPMVFDFGNPTERQGYFFENCIGRFKHRYIVRSIDSRTVKITNKKLFARWIEDYGIDDDYVKVRVYGKFPDAGSIQFIPTNEVEEAMERITPSYQETEGAALVIGVDVARFGEDESVIKVRLGNDARSYPAKYFRKLDIVQLSGRVIETIKEFRAMGIEPSAIFIDGGGVGGGVYDTLFHAGYDVTEVGFGTKPVDTGTYRYTSDEMWGKMRDAIKRNLVLPEGEEGRVLKTQLTQRAFGYTKVGDKIHLETKADMKSRGAESPDRADALALTFYRDVEPRHMVSGSGPKQAVSDYDPLDPAF